MRNILFQTIQVYDTTAQQQILHILDIPNDVIKDSAESQIFSDITLNTITIFDKMINLKNLSKFQPDSEELASKISFSNININGVIGQFPPTSQVNDAIYSCFYFDSSFLAINTSSCRNIQFTYPSETEEIKLLAYSCGYLRGQSQIWFNTYTCDTTTMTEDELSLLENSNLIKHESSILYLDVKSSVHINSSTIQNHQISAGGIVTNWSWVWVQSSTFSNNQSLNTEGAIVFQVNSLSNLHLKEGNTFSGNNCESCSSVIESSENSEIQIDQNNTFQNNNVNSSGVISITTGGINIEGSTFESNQCTLGQGILTAKLTSVQINNCNFITNTSRKNQIYIGESMGSIQNSTFNKNTATVRSQNIYVSESTDIEIISNTFIGKADQEITGNIKIKGDFISISETKTTIADNTFTQGVAYEGGAVSISCSSSDLLVTLERNTFTGNQATKNGGAIFVEGYATLNTNTFTNNSANQNGSSIYTASNAVLNIVAMTSKIIKGVSIYVNNYCSLIGDQLTIEFLDENGDFNSNTDYASGIICQDCSQLSIQNSSLKNFHQTQNDEGSGLIVIATKSDLQQVVQVQDTLFEGNQGKNGPGLYVSQIQRKEQIQSKIILSDCTFKNNRALYDEQNLQNLEEGYGGGIYLQTGQKDISIEFQNSNTFENNQAKAGGGYYFKKYPPTILTDGEQPTFNFSGNQALYGQNIGSYGTKLRVIQNPDESIWGDYVSQLNNTIFGTTNRRVLTTSTYDTSSESVSGQPIYPPIVIEILDEFDNKLTLDSQSQLKVSALTDSTDAGMKETFGNYTQFTAVQGNYILYPFSVLKKPENTASFKFQSTGITYLSDRTDEISYIDSISISTEVRQCILGEKLTDNYACIACPQNYYSLFNYFTETVDTNNLPKCIECPTGGVCKGKDQIGPQNRYWKLDDKVEKFHKCYNKVACLGAEVESGYDMDGVYCDYNYHNDQSWCTTGYCSKGYEGILCASCAEGYARDNPLFRTCVSCTSNNWYYIKGSLILALGITLLIFLVWNSLKKSSKKRKIVEEVEKQVSGQKSSNPLEEQYTQLQEKSHKDFDSPQIETPYTQGKSSSNKFQNIFQQRRTSKDINRVYKQETSPINNQRASNMNTDLIQLSDSDESDEEIDVQEQKKQQKIKEELEKEDVSPVYTKILFNYIQIVAVIGTFEFNWPQTVTYLNQQNTEIMASTQAFFSLDCLMKLKFFTDRGMRVFFIKLMFYALSPVLFVFLSIIFWLLVFRFKKKYREMEKSEKKEQFYCYLITTIIILLFAVHPNIIQQSLQAFSCINVGDDNFSLVVLEQDLEIVCWESYHNYYAYMIALPSLIFWGVGIPLLSFSILTYNRKNLENLENKARYGFLYLGFKTKFYFWEFIIFYRKLLIIFISVFMNGYSANIQATLVLGIGVLNYLYHRKYTPFHLDVLNELELRSLWCSTITLYCALYFLTGEFDSALMSYLLFFVIVLFTCYFLLFWVQQFLIEKSQKLMEIKVAALLCGWLLRRIIGSGRFKYRGKVDPNSLVRVVPDVDGNLKEIRRQKLVLDKFMAVKKNDDEEDQQKQNKKQEEEEAKEDL